MTDKASPLVRLCAKKEKSRRNNNIHDTPSKAWVVSPEHLEWLSQQQFMAHNVDAQVKPVWLTLQKTLAMYEKDLMEEQLEIDAHKGPGGHLKRWKTKQGVYQLKDAEKIDQASPNTEEATYAEVLQDV